MFWKTKRQRLVLIKHKLQTNWRGYFSQRNYGDCKENYRILYNKAVREYNREKFWWMPVKRYLEANG